MKAQNFLRRNPLAFLLVPLALAAVTIGICLILINTVGKPYVSLISWVFVENKNTSEPQNLFDEANKLLEGQEPGEEPPETVSKADFTYPSRGDQFGQISVSGTTVNAPLFYGDDNPSLNRGAGVYVESLGAGIPGEGCTILIAGHNQTFFSDLQHVEPGAIVTIETNYGTYTYTVEKCEVHTDPWTDAYDFSRTDENLILYTCYPFSQMGSTPDRYFVYASYTSGPRMVEADAEDDAAATASPAA